MPVLSSVDAKKRSSHGGLDMETSDGLYSIANTVGLKNEADRVVEPLKGESGKFLSGGWISDSMDVLNAMDYGVVGMLKGKTFSEGVHNRESFSDSDSLGRYGVAGKIAGFVADVVVDPMNLIAPLKVLKLLGAGARFTKLDKLASPLIGRLAGGDVTVMASDGARATVTQGANPLVDGVRKLFQWDYGSSKQSFESFSVARGLSTEKAHQATKIFSSVSELPPEVKSKMLRHADDGTVRFVTEAEIKRDFTGNAQASVLNLKAFMDDMDAKLIAEGGISKEHLIDNFLTQEYDGVIKAKAASPNGAGKGSSLFKSRKDMTAEERAALGPVENADVVIAATLAKKQKLYQNSVVANSLRGFSATEDDLIREIATGRFTKQEVDKLFKQVPDNTQFKTRAREFELKSAIGETGAKIKPVLDLVRSCGKSAYCFIENPYEGESIEFKMDEDF